MGRALGVKQEFHLPVCTAIRHRKHVLLQRVCPSRGIRQDEYVRRRYIPEKQFWHHRAMDALNRRIVSDSRLLVHMHEKHSRMAAQGA